MIIGGILALPLGIIAIISAVYTRKKIRQAAMNTEEALKEKSENTEISEGITRASKCIDEGKLEDALKIYEEMLLRYPANPRCPEIGDAILRLRKRIGNQ
jgi:outer membrane protein assembly factor BamD (BamD/ComL family)